MCDVVYNFVILSLTLARSCVSDSFPSFPSCTWERPCQRSFAASASSLRRRVVARNFPVIPLALPNTTSSIPSMKLPKMPRRKNRNQNPPTRKRPNIRQRTNIKLPHLHHQQISHHHIEPTPNHIHRRRRKPLTRRLRKGTLKSPPHQPTHQMRNGISQKGPTKKIRNIV